MNLSQEEAREALKEISLAAELTRKSIAQGSSSAILILWGLVWTACYTVSQFAPDRAGQAWMIGILIGVAGSVTFGIRFQSKVRSPHDLKIGLSWLVLFAFAGLWAFILLPVGMTLEMVDGGSVDEAMERKMGAYGATVPMFLYILGGMWIGRFFVYLGLFVTGLTLIGYLFAGPWFFLWMAVTGGGALILSGAFIRRFWR